MPRPAERSYLPAFQNVSREHGFEPLRVEGDLPAGLKGTLYRNGPGLLENQGFRYGHWFDGDGAVSAVRFADGGAEGAVRVLDTAGLAEERRKGRVYFGSYGTKPPGRLWNPMLTYRLLKGTAKNVANTSVMLWQDRLLALCEIGRPFEVDPDDLASIGETDLGHTVPGPFSAHPHRVAATGDQFNIGTRVARPNALDVFALPARGAAKRLVQLPLSVPTMIHDFAATEKHLVVFVAPLKLRLLPLILQREAFDQCLTWGPEHGTEVIVIPLDDPHGARRFRVDPFWMWHTGNAYEDGDTIVVDLVRYDEFSRSNEWLRSVVHGECDTAAEGELSRCVIDPKRESVRFTPMHDRTTEFPQIAPRAHAARHRFLYLAEHSTPEVGRYGPPDALIKVDSETGDVERFVFGDGHKPSEAVFVPDPAASDEDAGWLLTQVYDPSSHTTYWAVLDARGIADGPIATAHMDHHVPLGFHGAWRPAP